MSEERDDTREPTVEELHEQLGESGAVRELQEDIAERLARIRDTSLLLRIKQEIDDLIANDSLTEFDLVLATLLEPEEPSELELDLEVPRESPLDRFEAWAAPWMFLITCVHLVITGLVLLIVPEPGLEATGTALLWTLLAVHTPFIAEFAVVATLARKPESGARSGLLSRRAIALILPPARLGMCHARDGKLLWLPGWSWCRVNNALFLELKQRFSTPMILVALLIVPILVAEWKFEGLILDYMSRETMTLVMRCVEALIWAAFTFEFAIMFSVVDERLDYCKSNWLDILIILLPLISFMRALRVLRAARLHQLTRTFRLRGVITKARQALVMAELVQRILFPDPNRQINNLRKKFKKNQRDRKELERLALMAVNRLQKKRDKAAAKQAKKDAARDEA